jgi:hypothetical protein
MLRSHLRSGSFFGCVVAALFAFGCSSGSADDAGDDQGALEHERSGDGVSLHLAIAESKVVFDSKVESFNVAGAAAQALPCRDRGFHMTSKKTLYASGWSPDDAASFAENVDGAAFRDYVYASCRDAKSEVFAWFGKSFDIELSVSERLLDEDYKPAHDPLLLRQAAIGSGAPKYYSCDADFQKKLVSETENAKHYDISVACKARSAPTKAELGPADFVAKPGPYAAVASYNDWALPSVESSDSSFERVRSAFVGKVPEGTYSGAMSTLSKTCKMHVQKTAEGLAVDHTIDSSNRTRHLDLRAADLLGFVEGDLFDDPIRVTAQKVGKFAAAEFKDGKGGSFVVRFEDNTTLDAKVVRINGSEAYCRRLVKQ